jgi:eukaryotic-like serine/threonine-protein kinase
VQQGMPEAGAVFADRYEILEAVGRGATAVVYRARDLKHDRFVALKVLHQELTQSISAERFAREIGISAKLTHPNVLALFDSGSSNGCFYYVTPFIEGESLRERLRREGKLTVRDAVGMSRGVAAALAYAHGCGIVHRDIKPENILLVGGEPLVADFGIARVLTPGTDARMTSTGMIIGTPAYMSPEQAAGEEAVDQRSDLYSFGCVLFEMLAGTAPFTGATPAAAIAARFTQEPPDVRQSRTDVPELLADVITALITRSIDERMQSAEELRHLLDAVEPGATGATQAIIGRTRRTTSLRRRHGRRVVIAMTITAIAATGWLVLGSADPRIQKIAVMPLTNLSGDVQQEFVADGLTEGLITDLMRLRDVTVISRTSVMQYKMMRKPAPEVARELNVDAVVEASFTRDGRDIIITAGLVSGRDGRTLWRDTYRGAADSIFTLQRRVSAAVASEIGARLAMPVNQAAVKSESVEHYLRGASYAAQWRLEEALPSLQRAVEIDPTNAQAYAALARAHYFRAQFGEVAPQEAFSQMRRAAAAAIAQDRELGEAYGLMALVNTHFDYDWAGAEENFIRALKLSPSNAQVHHDYAHFLLAMGRGVESVESSRRAVQLDPSNAMLMSCLGWHNLFDDRYDEALRHAGEAQRMMPSVWALVVQGWAQTGLGEADAAIASMRDAVDLDPDLAFSRAALAHALARNGESSEARALLDQLLADERLGYVSAYDIALVYAGLGENDSAFEWIAKAVAERSSFVVHLTWDARLEPLRSDRRFTELVQRLGIPSAISPAVPRGGVTLPDAGPHQRKQAGGWTPGVSPRVHPARAPGYATSARGASTPSPHRALPESPG